MSSLFHASRDKESNQPGDLAQVASHASSSGCFSCHAQDIAPYKALNSLLYLLFPQLSELEKECNNDTVCVCVCI